MAGVAGAVIGLTTGAQANIAGAKALVDATTTGRGCTTNFIGFGLGLTNQVQSQGAPGAGPREDFNVTDDTVTLAIAAGADYEPTYTLDILSWEEVVVGP